MFSRVESVTSDSYYGRGHCVVLLGQHLTLTVPLRPGALLGTGEFNGGSRWVTLHWTSIPNTSSRWIVISSVNIDLLPFDADFTQNAVHNQNVTVLLTDRGNRPLALRGHVASFL